MQNGTNGVFQNATIRQTVYLTQDASTIRLHFSNALSGSDLPITAVTVAFPLKGTAGSSAIRTETLKDVTFSGSRSFIVPNGALVVSDPIRLSVKAQTSLTITAYLASGQSGFAITGHPGSRTTSWLAQGNLVSAADLNTTATAATTQRTDHWYFLSTIQAYLPSRNTAVAIVGDSITDGRGSTTNGNDRWPDQLLTRLQSSQALKSTALLNLAAGGNRVLADSLGPNALGRLERDVLAHGPTVRSALIYIGVNDLGTAASTTAAQTAVADRLIQAYSQMITRLHNAGIAAWGATITPMTAVGQEYGTAEREAARQRVNKWIRESGRFDAVVDFDKAVRDKSNATILRAEYDSGDGLHLNPVGYKAMAAAVDLRLFDKFRDGVDVMV